MGCAAPRIAKEAAPNSGLPLCETALLRCLELLDHPQVPEPPDVIIETTGVADGVTKLDSLRVWGRLIEDVGHTYGERGVVEDILPARHGVRNRRRFLLLAYHFLAALGIPRHRRRFDRRREDQGVGELRIYKVSRMHIVFLSETIQPEGVELFMVSIQEMPSPVHVPVVPGPVDGGVPSPFQPGLRIGCVPEKAANIPLGTGEAGYLVRPFLGVVDHELVQISPPA